MLRKRKDGSKNKSKEKKGGMGMKYIVRVNNIKKKAMSVPRKGRVEELNKIIRQYSTIERRAS